MTWYLGLTDDPDRRREEHGNPTDWKHFEFESEEQARAWEKQYVDKPGYQCGTGGSGWKYGYFYTITNETKQ